MAVTYIIIKMNSELDKIKSTITISLGMKNRLRKLKGNMSYESFIAKLIRQRHKSLYNDTNNLIEIQKMKRKESVISLQKYKQEYKIIFSYNSYNHSKNFIFDININYVRKNGKKILFSNMISEIKNNILNTDEKEIIKESYQIYFSLLTDTIKKEIEPMFKHQGRIEDYYLWKTEFEQLSLSKKSFEYDVMDKLTDMEHGVYYQ